MSTAQAFDLSGHRVLVTGAGRGLGEACAKTLAQAGSEVVFVARSLDQLEAVQQSIIDSGGNASVHAAGLTDMNVIRNLEKLGAFTILVNNAGINCPEPFEEVSEENFEAVMDLNVKSAFFVAQSVVRGHDTGRQVRLSDQHVESDGACGRTRPHSLLCD